jgi:amino acid adenylation domain-containing protein
MNDRRNTLVLQLKGLFGELTGQDLSNTDSGASFFDLGFDSLLLTQVSQSVQSRFGVKVTFRQIMNDLGSLDSLAGFLDGKLAPEAFSEVSSQVSSVSLSVVPPPAEAAPAVPIPSVLARPQVEAPMPNQEPAQFAPVAETAPGSFGPLLQGDCSVIERVVRQQLQVMNQQLDILRRRPMAAAGPVPSVQIPMPSATVPVTAPRAARPVVKAVKGEGDDAKRFGPFKGIEKGPTGGLTARQEKALADLIARYNQRTPGSKRISQEYRKYFCDPRAAGGFRQMWKEMVYPIVCARSLGSRIWDIDGNEYIDVTMGFGANYLGHSPDFVMRAVEAQMKLGVEIGPQSPLAGETAKLICEFTGMERATFCNTGSEAVMAALRVARTVTGREKFVFFKGDYHGIFDEILARPALVDGLPGAMPIAPGIPHLANVIVLEYGNPASLEIISRHADEIAAVLIEPIQARHPDLQPREFIQELRKVTAEKDIALIFDEVITGFRVAPGGAQEYFGVRADLATYGKIVGGGMPIGVLAGSARFMDALDGGFWRYGDESYPEVGVTFFAGTFVRHPLALAAANAVIKYLKACGPSLQQAANDCTARFVNRLNAFFEERQLPMRLPSFSTVCHYDFHPDLHYAGLLFYYLRNRGVHIWEGRVCHLSTAHTDADLDFVFNAFKESVLEMQEAGFLPATPGKDDLVDPKTVQGEFASPPQKLSVPSGNRFPLTEAQTEMWVGSQVRPEASGAHNAANVVHVKGKIDVAKLREALAEVINRHEGLRSTFSPDGSEVIVAPSVAADLLLHDLSGLAPADRDARVQEILNQDGKRIFDLVKGPLFSFQLITLGPEEHLLVFSVQMIVCDGWSYNVVLEDLSAIYSALVEDHRPALEPAVPMREYVVRQRELAKTSEAKACEEFWLSKFKTLPPPFDLPSFRPRLPARSFDGGRRSLRLSPEFYQSIKRVGKELGNTPFVLLLSAYQTWLYRLSAVDDLVIGVPFAGQGALGLDTLVGQCVHTLPFRFKLDPAEPFSSVLRRTRDLVIDAQEYWNYSFGALIQKLDLPRDASRIPLVSVTFNLDPPLSKVQLAGCSHTITAGPRFYFQYDLGFNLVDEGSTLLIECDFNRNLFDDQTIGAWLGHFQTLLAGILANPREVVGRLPLLSEAELRHVRRESEVSPMAPPPPTTLHSLVSAQAARTPNVIAVESAGQSLTYEELDRRSNQMGHHLQAAGVVPGVTVAVCLDRTVDLPVALLATLKCGAAYIPLDPEFPRDRLALLMEDSAPAVLLTQSKLLSRLPEIQARLVCLDEDSDAVAREETGPVMAAAGPDDLVYIIYTSGSTGRPRGVEVTHRALANFLISMQREPGLKPEDVVLAMTTLSFDISALELFLPLIVGARSFIVGRDVSVDPRQIAELLVEVGITVMQATPATWRMLFESGWSGKAGLKTLCGGEALTTDLSNRLLSCCGEVWNMYGPTETTVWCSAQRVLPDETITIGEPIANTWLAVVDDRLQPVPVGVPGEIIVGGVGLARGYRNRPELTAERFVADPENTSSRIYRTGDLGRYRLNGRIEWIGRLDFQVKLRGYRIELGEIESLLLAHPRVSEAIVVVREDSPGERRLVAYIVERRTGITTDSPKERKEAPFVRELRGWLRRKLPDYMVPAVFVTLERMPKTPQGKSDRIALPTPAIEAEIPEKDYVPARNAREEKLVEIWADLLKVPQVGIRDNFFDLGGQSLMAVKLFARIERELNRKLPLATLFQCPTIEQLAAALDGEAKEGTNWASLVSIQPKGTRPSLFLVHGAGGNVLLYRALAQHLAPEYPLYGLQSRGLDGKTPPLTTIEEMAAHYLEEVRSIQSRGPYFLGGYCLGGTIAYEMAQRLLTDGEKVALVAMLDTYNFSRALKASFTGFLVEKVKFHLGNIARLQPGEFVKYLREKIRVAKDGELANLRSSMPGISAQLGVARAESGIEASVQAINDNAAEIYLPKPLACRLTLFKPQANYKFYPDPLMGWGDLAKGGLAIVELPINPHAMLVEPFVQRLAQEIKNKIDETKPGAGETAGVNIPQGRVPISEVAGA